MKRLFVIVLPILVLLLLVAAGVGRWRAGPSASHPVTQPLATSPSAGQHEMERGENVQLRATTRPHDDPAKRMAGELSGYLQDAAVESVEFRYSDEAEPRLRLDDRDDVAALVKSFINALAGDDLQEGTQRHRSWPHVRIDFNIKGGPDIRLTYVGVDMFWAARGDEQAEWKPESINLQTPALTNCFAEHMRKLPPPTWRPGGAK